MSAKHLNSFNLLIWKDGNKLPFPQETRDAIEGIDFDEFIWHCTGLSVDGATYTIEGFKSLYFESDSLGNTKIEKQDDFNGDIYFSGYFLSKDRQNGTNFLITFKAVFLKGELIEVVLNNLERHDAKKFFEDSEKINQDFSKRLKRSTKIWYKYLYKPYSVAVRSIAYYLVVFCLKLKDYITRFALWITP